MNKSIFFLLLASTVFTSCKREITLFSGENRKFEINEFQFEYLESKAKFKYTTGNKKTSAVANFRIKKDSIIWVSISPGLGIELARVHISRDRIQLIDKLKRDYYEFDYTTLTETYGVEINYDLIESVVLGNTLFRPERRRDISKDEEYFSFTKINGPYGVSHYVGIISQKLEKLYAFDQTTNNSISVNYGRFSKVENQILPQSISANIEFSNEDQDDTKIQIDYNRTVLSKQPLKFPFYVSSKYTRK